MPFKRRGNKFLKDGKVWSAKQVRAYYATSGFKRKPRKQK